MLYIWSSKTWQDKKEIRQKYLYVLTCIEAQFGHITEGGRGHIPSLEKSKCIISQPFLTFPMLSSKNKLHHWLSCEKLTQEILLIRDESEYET